MRDVAPGELPENQILANADLKKMGFSGRRICTLVRQGRLHRGEAWGLHHLPTERIAAVACPET